MSPEHSQLLQLENAEATTASLRLFLSCVQNHFSQVERISKTKMPEPLRRNFGAKVFHIEKVGDTFRPEPHTKFCPDESFVLIVGVKDPETSLFGISFTSLDRASHGPRDQLANSPEAKSQPVIVQIQTCEVKGEEYLRIKQEILTNFRWEKFITALLVCWAKLEKISAVFINPSRKNIWRVSVPDDVLKRRYDVTANRMDFDFDNESTWLWKLDLSET